jgi:hypothetical protein
MHEKALDNFRGRRHSAAVWAEVATFAGMKMAGSEAEMGFADGPATLNDDRSVERAPLPGP